METWPVEVKYKKLISDIDGTENTNDKEEEDVVMVMMMGMVMVFKMVIRIVVTL